MLKHYALHHFEDNTPRQLFPNSRHKSRTKQIKSSFYAGTKKLPKPLEQTHATIWYIRIVPTKWGKMQEGYETNTRVSLPPGTRQKTEKDKPGLVRKEESIYNISLFQIRRTSRLECLNYRPQDG